MKKHLFSLILSGALPALAMNSSTENCIRSILASMTLEQKIAQLFMVPVVCDEQTNKDFMAKSPYRMDQKHVEELIEKYRVGSVIFLGNGTKTSVQNTIHQCSQKSVFPLLFAIDAEWGLNMRLTDELRLPRAMTLGALPEKDIERISQLGYIIGKTCKEMGIGMNCAPVADVNTNPENPIIGTRSFGQDPVNVAKKAAAFARGLETAGILACAKHFPGHGDTHIDSHHTLPTIERNRDHLDQVELRPFAHLIKQGVRACMIGHLQVPALDTKSPSSLSAPIIQQVLQKEMGFEGLVVTDGLGMGALLERMKPGEIECAALLAGNDILLGVLDVPGSIERIKQAITDGKISEEEIDHRVAKVLRAKEWTAKPISPRRELLNANAIKKDIFVRSITLVKNGMLEKHNKKILPLSLIANLMLTKTGITESITFFDALTRHIKHTPEEPPMTVIAFFPKKKKACIEMAENTQISSPSASALIEKYHQQNKPVIAILFDTPYRIAEIADADAIVCAYEDDPVAQQCAAWAVMGYFNPQGILPVSVGGFALGTGLKYLEK